MTASRKCHDRPSQFGHLKQQNSDIFGPGGFRPGAFKAVIRHAADSYDLTREGPGPIVVFLEDERFGPHASDIMLRLIHARNAAGSRATPRPCGGQLPLVSSSTPTGAMMLA